ncbi:hypothetical protein [Undibacterium fentianense]|uniref:DUF2975 domain-containing protein n=1 Tax=Undibacterium fentianense TaxID=2828728 RepID=A0A941E2L2_9BURK|nr:hypothetical protein [Undibacterium fentianense]MBR7801185.1 hypothetical protein [Undibacterium fentianense]
MNLERNQRIAAFRKVSGYLLWFSMPLLIVTCLGGLIGIIGLLSVQTGNVDIHQSMLKVMDDPTNFTEFVKPGLTTASKIFFTFALLALTVPLFYILLHLQKLIQCFHDGDIFNARALFHARAAYKINLYLGIAWIVASFGVLIYCFQFADGNLDRTLNWLWNTIVFFIELGFLSLILWALEIGTDLNEEAELTI